MKGKLTLLLIALVAVTGGGAIAANTVTLFDDGDPIYDHPTTGVQGVYDLGGAGRPAAASTPAGHTYDGQSYLTIWGDPRRSTARQADRVAAFIRGDVGLDTSQDYYIQWEFANDFVNADYAIMGWLVPAQPDATTLNTGAGIRDNMSWWMGCGDQLPGDNVRGGFWLVYYDTTVNFAGLNIDPRLDPDPDEPMLRGGNNVMTVQWIASQQKYYWRIANINGVREASLSQSQMGKPLPPTMYWALGTVDNAVFMASGWTIYKANYGQGIIPEPGSLAALGTGLLGLFGFMRRRR